MWDVGDVVMLASGGPKMTVAAVLESGTSVLRTRIYVYGWITKITKVGNRKTRSIQRHLLTP